MTGLLAWYDIQTTSSIHTTATVATLDDIGGGGHTLTKTIVSPIYSATGWNGTGASPNKPAISSVSNNYDLEGACGTTSAAAFSIIGAITPRIGGPAGGGRIFSFGPTATHASSQHSCILMCDNPVTTLTLFSNSTTVTKAISPDVPIAVFAIFDGANMKLYINNGTAALASFTDTIGVGGGNSLGLFCSYDAPSNAAGAGGTIGEFAVANSDVTSNLSSAYAYLKGRWSGLP